jgi:NAD(P)-dependent dehydrogenase (short-subunit alcohol dehydrogenase family)
LAWDLEGGVAVVTGAASGIGRALARRLAREKMSLALADVDRNGLEETARLVAAPAPNLSTHVVDVADRGTVERFAAEVVARHERVTLLVNNAGVAMYGTVEEVSLDEIDWLMRINFWGVVYGVKFFLPILRRQPRAHIANLSSIYGIISPAGQGAYCASKFAIRGFTEVLLHELEGTSVGVSCVHPGGIRTPIARKARVAAGVKDRSGRDQLIARFDEVARMLPEAAADRIVDGVKRGEPRILIGADAVSLDRLQRLLPVRYWRILRRRYAALLEGSTSAGKR